MPKKVDRRAEIADALWRVTRRDGWEAVTMRQVAAEAGVSVGMVQHHFASKDQMLRFALDKIGTDYGGRIAARIGALPEPRDPREVVRIVLTELLPGEGEGHVEVQAAAAFLGRAVLHPEIAAPMVAAGARLRDYVAAQIRTARPDADADLDAARPDADSDLDAAGLLALADGLIAHLLTGRLTAEMAHAILAAQLDRVFGGSDAAQH